MRESFGKIADPYPEEDDVKFCELLLKYFKGVIPEPLLSRLKENIPMGAWSIFCTPESFMNLPANPVFPDDKKTLLENKIVASKPKARKEMLQAVDGGTQVTDSSPQVSQSTLSVVKVEGAAKTYPRQKIVYKAECNKKRNEMSDEEIKWAVKVEEGGNNIELPDRGEKITLDIKPEWGNNNVNKIIRVMAYIENTKKKECKTEVLSDPYKGTTLIRGVIGEDEAMPGQEAEYETVNSNQDGEAGKVGSGSDVKWAIKVGRNGNIDKEMLGGERGKKVITLKMKQEWLDEEITVMPYLNSPTETVSVKTMIVPIVKKTIYITQGNAVQDIIQKFKEKVGEPHTEEDAKRLNETHITFNKKAHEDFKKYAFDAREKLEAEGFNVVINPCITKKEYIEMMRNPKLIAYYMDAHGSYLEKEETGGFYLFKDKPDFNDQNWSINIKDNSSDFITPESFINGDIKSRPDLLLVYQISCENVDVKWKPHLGESVEHFQEEERFEDGKFKSYFKPERIECFVNNIIRRLR